MFHAFVNWEGLPSRPEESQVTEILAVEMLLLYSLSCVSAFPDRGFSNTGNRQTVSMSLSLVEKGAQNVRQAACSQGSGRGLRSMGSGFLILTLPNSSLNLELVAHILSFNFLISKLEIKIVLTSSA